MRPRYHSISQIQYEFSFARIFTLFISLLLVECGGGATSVASDPVPNNPLWISIYSTSTALSTTSIELSGWAYCDDCTPPPAASAGCPAYGNRGSSIGITWKNMTTGEEGVAMHGITGTCTCDGYLLWLICSVDYVHEWSAGIPIVAGTNNIEVKATDASGNFAIDSIAIMNQFAVQSNLPANNATSVPINTTISVTLNGPIDSQSVSSSSFVVSEPRGMLNGNYSVSGSTVIFTPTNNLYGETTYTVTVTPDIKDMSGNAALNHSWSFTTALMPDSVPPTVLFVVPANNSIGLGTNIGITATFSEPMDATTINAATFTLNNGVTGTITYDGNTAKFMPTSLLAGSTAYMATITTNVKDAAGNAMFMPYSWTFTTDAGLDLTPPTVVSTTPVNNATGVGLNSAITATFSEPMDVTTVNAATFTLNNGASGPVTYTENIASMLIPNLSSSIRYLATITTGAKDAAGNPVAAPYTWSFSTATTGASFKMPDTSQATSYTTTFGADNDYAINPPSYADNGDGTVSDFITNLVWQQLDDSVFRTWDQAVAYCSNLTLAGKIDWRLPSRIELISIVEYHGISPAIDSIYFPFTKNSNYWTSTESVGVTNPWGVQLDAWGVDFGQGSSEYNVKDTHVPGFGLIGNYVRCVRNGP